MNPTVFFNHVRQSLFGGSLKQRQVNGLNEILNATDGVFSIEQQAYILATVYHETAKTMQPIAEYGKGAGRIYGTWRTNSKGEQYCFKNGNSDDVYTKSEYPHLYYGRGYVQLTWLDNYQRAGRALGAVLDDADQLAREPSLAMRPDIAAMILCLGMRDGWFTGKKLSDYINAQKTDYVRARRVVNGDDAAHKIAQFTLYFEKALRN